MTTTTHHLSPLINLSLQITKSLHQIKQAHAHLLKTETQTQITNSLIPLTTALLHLPGNNLRYAHQLFDQIPNCNNQKLWTALIRCHSLHAQFPHSISLYARMHRQSVPPNAFTFTSVLNACARAPATRQGEQVHARIAHSGFLANQVVQTALLDMYAKWGCVEDAREVFDEMPERDVVAWTAMVAGYAKAGMVGAAREVFDAMGERNVVSWTAMVAGYASLGDVEAAKELFDEMPVRNAVTWTAMIAGYGKVGDVGSAEKVFGEVPRPDESCWAAMIACYSQNGWSREAIGMYKKMRGGNVKASEVAMVGVISACTQIGDIDTAELITDHIEHWSCNRTLVVSNALIHMHAKCGSIDRALNEFNRMRERDVISYSALITALADHGMANEALELFSRMQSEGIEPNQVTFVGVLNACSHAGLVNEGCKYFKLMTKTYGITPLTEHFACMVDLMSRAGRTCEAYQLLLDNVGGANDAGAWGALLGACRVHGHVELGEIAAARLFEIEPDNTGNYVLLANLYASRGRWDDAARVRKKMDEKGAVKSPGCSWISKKINQQLQLIEC
ncbi:hypothetical protein Scep_007937 [Stephania cephalantha]|uniref:Pentatricopeptide repeat-containing protein n=1 Tax=Stephania cephalantha TaxID=152367 RepID=A0AAP0KC14_9MAGN